MSSLKQWQIATLILAGLVLGYAGGKVEYYLVDNTATNPNTIAKEEINLPIPEQQNPVLNKEDQKLLVDEDGSDPMLGNKDAKVTIVEFSEFQCPFCKKYSEGAFAQIKKDYIDTGKVKYYFRDLPLGFHPQAKPAAKTANCAFEQNKYWKMHDKLFEKQSEWTTSSEADQLFATYAAELGLNVEKFETCVADQKTLDEIENDYITGSKLGASGTPTFFINGKKLVGARPYEQFKAEIEAAL